jgi:hypothetical protein
MAYCIQKGLSPAEQEKRKTLTWMKAVRVQCLLEESWGKWRLPVGNDWQVCVCRGLAPPQKTLSERGSRLDVCPNKKPGKNTCQVIFRADIFIRIQSIEGFCGAWKTMFFFFFSCSLPSVIKQCSQRWTYVYSDMLARLCFQKIFILR